MIHILTFTISSEPPFISTCDCTKSNSAPGINELIRLLLRLQVSHPHGHRLCTLSCPKRFILGAIGQVELSNQEPTSWLP